MSKVLLLLSMADSWLNIHGSELTIAIIAAVVGAIVSVLFDFRGHTIKIATRFKTINKNRSRQTQHISGSPGARTVGRDNYEFKGPVSFGDPSSPDTPQVESLDENQKYICKRVLEISRVRRHTGLDLLVVYAEAARYLNDGAGRPALSEFHRVWQQIIQLFESTSDPNNVEEQRRLASLRAAFNALADLLTSDATGDLRTVVKGCEDTLILRVLPHTP